MRRTRIDQSGVALVLVVLSLTMIALLIVAFLSMANVERRSTNSYVESANVRTLSDDAANVVIGQLRQATSNLGSTKTWASQPGAIRTYGTKPSGKNDGRAKLEEIYKLYSSDKMVEGSDFDPKLEVPRADWITKAGIYTDLNEPVTVSDANSSQPKLAFPILTPPEKWTNPQSPNEKYEIEGFDLDNTGVSAEGSSAVPGATSRQPVPMPVKWLYQLKDGRFVAPTSQQEKTVSFPPGLVSKDNPIIGRVAFWADDESAKVNVNTASQGAFYDNCLGNTKIDRGNAANITVKPPAPTGLGFATSLPARYEFPRYTGHPARTCLSAVIGRWFNPVTDPSNPNYRTTLDQYFKLNPRVALGGSYGGTKGNKDVYNDYPGAEGIKPLDTERLYASADEMFYAQKMSPQPPSSSSVRVQGDTRLTPEVMEKTRFFLTANSRAPEVNLFNQPRISLWPVAKDPNSRNINDKYLAFAATTAPGDLTKERRYYYQRNRIAFGNTSAESPTEDLNSIPRNVELYNYLTTLMSTSVPGYGESFKKKYGPDSDQIALEMLDYVRCQVYPVASQALPPFNHYMAGNLGANTAELWQVPLQYPPQAPTMNAVGARMGTVTEAALVMYGTAAQGDGSAGKVQAFLILQFFRPCTLKMGADMWVDIKGLEKFSLNGKSMNFPAAAKTRHNQPAYVGHAMPFQRLMIPFCINTADGQLNTSYPFKSTQDIDLGAGQTMSFVGGKITITLSVGSGVAANTVIQTTTIDFPSAAAWPRPKMTDTSLNGKRTFAARMSAGVNGAQEGYGTWTNLVNKTNGGGKDYRRILINSEDVVRSVQADPDNGARADYRMFAGRRNVPYTWFKPHKSYQSADWLDRQAHGLREDRWGFHGQIGWNPRGDTPDNEVPSSVANAKFRPRRDNWSGSLVKGLKHAPGAFPAAPSGMDGAMLKTPAGDRPGDWENGWGIFGDGPYIRTPFWASSDPSMDDAVGSGGLFMYGSFWGENVGVNATPNREIASAAQFGALPTGVLAEKPWQTLLFCPNPASRTTVSTGEPSGPDHPGFDVIRDHVILDFFWMPVVEPYAISEPFSTAGKVNMNYEILPFRYIKRRTAINAVLKDVQLAALPPALAKDSNSSQVSSDNYKGMNQCPYDFRYKVNTDGAGGTLEGFERRFLSGDIFHSASEICDIYLIPKPYNANTKYHPTAPPVPNYNGAQGWWNAMTLTGDNARENPYNDIYPRLTTKSNVFRVHVRVQTIKASPSDKPDTWTMAPERIGGEYRGSLLVERFVDTTEKNLPDFAKNKLVGDSLDKYYKYRIVDRKQFTR